MTAAHRKNAICTLLKGIETGDPAAVAVVDEAKYIQHNPQTREGSEGLAHLFARLAKTNPRVNIVRIFADGDFVFGHTEYDFATRRIGFEVFRFEGDRAVEPWDNIQPRRGPNASSRSMVDGPTEPVDLEQKEENRALVRSFVEDALIGRRRDLLPKFFDGDQLTQHSPELEDGLPALIAALDVSSGHSIAYQRVYRVLAEGSFARRVSGGTRDGDHSAFYDLFRVEDGKRAEHWDTVEHAAPVSEWKNQNGKL
ncbi:MAG: putative SnoaL-like aldol condensation-catalyzing enzyme [Flavobacteriales bacterium]|jgi:predicted SnoaL-like aldol condensation-catalyzing enzyme